MSTLAVRVEGLGKCYRLGVGATAGQLLSERLTKAFRRPFTRTDAGGANSRPTDFWALSGVTFDVHRGDTVGIVGRNGAGKSTLLKVLARITAPSTGRVELYGRAGALLEVGTGFHPELTGRENVFLNGAILGMRRAEDTRKFDEIVAFAELDRFIDTPVKRYSSGMAVRLAFAVAAHLEPEILIVDVVLAVGDLSFQRKCIGKMGDVAREGRTVLFVSHDLAAVQVLCQKAVYLHEGRVQQSGPVSEIVTTYVNAAAGLEKGVLDRPVAIAPGIEYRAFGFPAGAVVSGQPATFELELVSDADLRLDELEAIINDSLGRRVAIIDFRRGEHQLRCEAGTPARFTATLADLPLVEGEYRVGTFIRGDHVTELRHDLITLDVTARSDNKFVPHRAEMRGVVDLVYDIRAS